MLKRRKAVRQESRSRQRKLLQSRKLLCKMDDDEIRRRKLEEIRQRYHHGMENQAQDEENLHQQIQQIELIVKKKMTKEALQRYSNIKAADQERSVQVI